MASETWETLPNSTSRTPSLAVVELAGGRGRSTSAGAPRAAKAPGSRQGLSSLSRYFAAPWKDPAKPGGRAKARCDTGSTGRRLMGLGARREPAPLTSGARRRRDGSGSNSVHLLGTPSGRTPYERPALPLEFRSTLRRLHRSRLVCRPTGPAEWSLRLRAHARPNDPTARFHDLGADYHTTRINTECRTRNYVTQVIAMGYRVTPEPAA
jgi:hypothetical protein